MDWNPGLGGASRASTYMEKAVAWQRSRTASRTTPERARGGETGSGAALGRRTSRQRFTVMLSWRATESNSFCIALVTAGFLTRSNETMEEAQARRVIDVWSIPLSLTGISSSKKAHVFSNRVVSVKELTLGWS